MDCLRSFTFRIDVNTNISGTDIKQWAIGNNHFWSAQTLTVSTLNIQGFKNINVHGMDLLGSISTLTTAGTGGVIVNDWNLSIDINGQVPLLGNIISVAPNFYGIDQSSLSSTTFVLGKYSNSLKLADPITSVKSIRIQRTYASGIGYQTAADINLFWNLNCVVYYTFEGE